MRPANHRAVVFSSVILVLLGAGCAREPDAPVVTISPEQIEEALERAREGSETEAIAALEAIAAADPDGNVGDHAALVVGNLLLERRETGQAVSYLERAMGGTLAVSYAKILFARAVAEGGLGDRVEQALSAVAPLAPAAAAERPIVAEEAQFLLLRLLAQAGRQAEAAAAGQELLSRFPKGRHTDEARWQTAEALRGAGRLDDAYALYESIWIDTPGSSWATGAQRNLESLAGRVSIAPRQLAADTRLERIRKLRRAGLHLEALAEVDRFVALHPGHPRADEVLLLRTQSLHDLRRNEDCVRSADELRTRFPASKWVPEGQIQAIKALRRTDAVEPVRQRAEWVAQQYPRHPKAIEALYNLGVFLGNTVSEEAGLPALHRVIAEGGDHENVTDALWKIAWFEHLRGETEAAVTTLQRLLDEHPRTGYRPGALYWIGRFTAVSDPMRARAAFERCVVEFPHDYYGWQAKENLEGGLGVAAPRPGNGRPFPPFDDLSNPNRVQDGERSYQTAANLRKIGLYELAAWELERVPRVETDPGLQFALADLYARAGATWKANALLDKHFKEFVVAGSRERDAEGRYTLVSQAFWQTRYPFRFRRDIEKALAEAQLAGTQVNPWMVASLIRMESVFLTTATSPVGAVGLMQLMPDTAARIASGLGAPAPTRDALYRPEMNIRYGVNYLAGLVRQFSGDWFAAICSYNAGPEPVRSWLDKRPPGLPDDEFIERIPYVDTRRYIKRILGDYQNYRYHYPESS